MPVVADGNSISVGNRARPKSNTKAATPMNEERPIGLLVFSGAKINIYYIIIIIITLNTRYCGGEVFCFYIIIWLLFYRCAYAKRNEIVNNNL